MSTRACPRLLLSAALCAPLVAACGGGSSGSGNSFVLRTASNGVDATSEVVIAGQWMVYFGDEATSAAPPGVDLNGDGDFVDDVAVVTNLINLSETPLRAALGAAVVGNEIYLLVDESVDGPPPGMDWDLDGTFDDIVLLHWSSTAGVVTFVDTLDPNAAVAPESLLAVAGERIYYSSSAALVGLDDTSLRFVDKDDPLTPVVVLIAAGGGQLRPFLLGVVEGLVFLFLDETAGPAPFAGGGAPPDYNLDGDSLDGFVLALLDGTDELATVANVGLPLADAAAPFDARAGVDTWLVGFLANELAQGPGGTNFQDPVFFVNPIMPDSCAASPDIDVDDDVLHFLDYATFLLGTPPVNTGLAGVDRVIAIDSYVATISPEADATCNLNEDGDAGSGIDNVARWVEAVDPVAPPRDPSQLHALSDVPGGSHGLSSLGDRFVIVVDEAADGDNIDGKFANNTLVGFLDPTDGFLVTWTFAHPTTNPGTGIAGEPFVGANWMAPDEEEGRLGMVYQEEVPLMSINVDLFCDLVQKDADFTDSLPIWADFALGPILDFDGQGYALLESDPGVTLARGFAFYRVSEALDNRDYNNDGDTFDSILFRNPQTTCATVAMGTSSTLPPPNPAIITDGVNGAAYLASEIQAGIDFNFDGDFNDLVPRYFLF